MKIDMQKETGALVIRASGRIDTVSAPDFEKRMTEEIGKGECRFVIDFSDLEYISSAGLRSLLFAAKQLKGKGGSLLLCGLKGMVKEVFDLSGFTALFSVSESLEEAQKKLAQASSNSQ